MFNLPAPGLRVRGHETYVCAVLHQKLGHDAIALLRRDVEDCVALFVLGVHVKLLLAQQHLPRICSAHRMLRNEGQWPDACVSQSEIAGAHHRAKRPDGGKTGGGSRRGYDDHKLRPPVGGVGQLGSGVRLQFSHLQASRCEGGKGLTHLYHPDFAVVHQPPKHPGVIRVVGMLHPSTVQRGMTAPVPPARICTVHALLAQ